MKNKKSEYISARLQNRKDATNLLYLNQEPGSKNGMKPEAKKTFRKELNQRCVSHNSKEIALSIDFTNKSKNPPSVHKLVKNYLDLMHKPMPEIDSYKELLFIDDSQIRYLTASQYVFDTQDEEKGDTDWLYDADENLSEGSVYLESIDFPFFIEMVADAKNIRKDSSYGYDEDRFFRNGIDDYIESKKNHASNVEFLGENGAQSLLEASRMRAQQEFMKNLSITDDAIMDFLEPDIGLQEEHWNENLWKITKISLRNFYQLETRIATDMIPRREGDSKIFIEKIKAELKAYKERFKLLFPLIIPTSVFIVYTPPIGHEKDLDNVLLKLFPVIISEFEPPTQISFVLGDDVPKKRNSSIMKYEALRVAPNEDEPNGAVHICLRDQMFGKNFWESCKETIEKFDR